MIIPVFSLKLILGALAVGLVLQWVFAFLIKRTVRLKNFSFKLDPILGPFRILVPALTVAMTLPLLHLPDQMQTGLEHLIKLWIMAGIGWFLTKVVRIIRDIILRQHKVTPGDFNARRIYTQIRIIEHIVNFAIYVLTISLMIMTFSEIKEVGVSLFASAGIMSVIIGFAAQKTLGNLIAGIQIAIAQPIRLEDAVIVEGDWGWVEEINLTYVVVRTWDLRRIVLPISYFIEKPFQNWTRFSTNMLGTVFLYVDYTIELEPLRQELTNILKATARWDKQVNVIQVTDMKEKTMELRVLVSAADAGTCWDLRCEVREKLLLFLQKNHPQALPRLRVEMGDTNADRKERVP